MMKQLQARVLISSTLGLQQLEAGLWFLARLRLGLWQWEHQILVNQRSVTRPWLSGFARKRICTKRWKIVKPVFVRRKKRVSMTADRHTGRLRESSTLVVVWITFMGHCFQISFGQSFRFAWFWRSGYISGSSHVLTCISWPRWILVEEAYGSLTSITMRWCPLPFDLRSLSAYM